jgi:CYTH domain-containing protein
MGKEIERKFLVTGDAWRQGTGTHVRQGYISSGARHSVRVRATSVGAFLTVKGASRGATRSEFEYEIPLEDAEELLESICVKPLIEKIRYRIAHRGFTWEVDEFLGENRGLVIAEIELEREDEEFDRPDWVGEEVTGDPRYYNVNLVAKPYSAW